MTAETAPGRAEATSGGRAGSSLSDSMVRYGIWLAVVAHILGDRRFQATVITGALGGYALVSLIKNNQARPVRRAAAWYKGFGDVQGLRRARRALKTGNA